MTRVGAALLGACLALAGGACGPGEVRVGKARLAEADGVVAAPRGVDWVLPGDAPALAAGTVRVAADREVPFADVVAAERQVLAAGGTPVFLVARRRDVAALPPAAQAPAAGGSALRLTASAEGKACVAPPGSLEAACVRTAAGQRIDRAFVRELVRKAHKEYGLTRVHVEADPGLAWGDVVRAIDGARTCCPGVSIEVSVE